MTKKLLSINLWYSIYKNKTDMQLKCFRRHGYSTDLATIVKQDANICLLLYSSTDKGLILIFSKTFVSYRKAFNYLFNYCNEKAYDFVYIRRLMSKLFPAALYIKSLSKTIPIVYEIPTYPLDTGNTLLFQIRDYLEMKLYKMLNKHIRLTLVNLIDDSVSLPSNWSLFHNAIDIDDYQLFPPSVISDTIKFIIIANISEYHHYERFIVAMKEYSGIHNIELTIISPPSDSYTKIKSLVNELNLENQVVFYDSQSIETIQSIAKDCHIGVAQLSTSEKKSNLVNTLKSKDYCAMGLPFISTCYDTSFEKDFPYAYITESMDDKIDLSAIIEWYLNIYNNKNYRTEMYLYAKNNLQYDEFAQQIIDCIQNDVK